MAELPEETNGESSHTFLGAVFSTWRTEWREQIAEFVALWISGAILWSVGLRGVELGVTLMAISFIDVVVDGVKTYFRLSREASNDESQELTSSMRELESIVAVELHNSTELAKTAEAVQTLADNLRQTNLRSCYTFIADGQILVVEVDTEHYQTMITNEDFARTFTEQFRSIEPGLDSMKTCLLYTSPSPRDQRGSRMPSSA